MTDYELAEAVLEYEDAKAAEESATARRQDAQDRVAVLLDRLRLAALVGKLDEAELQQLNAHLLQPPSPR